MFNIGETIVYPMYGAGIVEAIEIEEVGGAEVRHYVIRIPNGNLKIKVGASKVEKVGIRKILPKEKVVESIKKVASVPIVIQNNWNLRYKENLDKIKQGTLEGVAEVARALCLRERHRGLSGAEKKMLNNARQIVISEVEFSCKIEKNKAEEYLAKELFC